MNQVSHFSLVRNLIIIARQRYVRVFINTVTYLILGYIEPHSLTSDG